MLVNSVRDIMKNSAIVYFLLLCMILIAMQVCFLNIDRRLIIARQVCLCCFTRQEIVAVNGVNVCVCCKYL